MFRLGITANFVLVPSLVIQVYAMVHITYYRWRYERQDNRVHVFHLTSFNQGGSNQHTPNKHNQEHDGTFASNLNTQTHNKIIFEIANMILFVITLITIYISTYILRYTFKEDYYGIHPAIYYFAEFSTGILFNVIYPCYFYTTNKDARMYFKKMFCKT